MKEENVETQTPKEEKPTEKAVEGVEKVEKPKVENKVGKQEIVKPELDAEKINNILKEQDQKIKDLELTIEKQKQELVVKELSGRGVISEPPEKDTRTPQQFSKDFLEGKIQNPFLI